MTLQEFAEKHFDKMYDSRIEEEFQSTGWKVLKDLVQNQADLNAYNLSAFHANLRNYLIQHWKVIKQLKVK